MNKPALPDVWRLTLGGRYVWFLSESEAKQYAVERFGAINLKQLTIYDLLRYANNMGFAHKGIENED